MKKENKNDQIASIIFVLHAHLPFVNHPASSSFLEENWFFEAVAETYVPLIKMCERLASANIRPSLTLSISPTLAAMLCNKELQSKLKNYILSRQELLKKEKTRVRGEHLLRNTIAIYERLYNDAMQVLEGNNWNLLEPLGALYRAGQIEIITTSATHAVLPLLVRKEAIHAQIATAVIDYERFFGHKPAGFWLPECAFDPGLAPLLRLEGIKYVFTEEHSLAGNEDNASAGVYASYRTRNGLNFFVRDYRSSAEVWSEENGCPGHYAYREFNRDIGFDAPLEYVRPYLGEEGVRRSLGIKYYRITDNKKDLSSKEYYDPALAFDQVEKDAEVFLNRRKEQIDSIYSSGKDHVADSVIVNCYDAELFGHWWFEGPAFLEALIRQNRKGRYPFRFVTPSEYLSSCPPFAEFTPEVSSWGKKGYFETWVNKSNDWIYSSLCAITDKMIDAANFFKTRHIEPVQERALNQAAREVLLAQSSDWPFLINKNSHVPYVTKRFNEHVRAAAELLSQSIQNRVSEKYLEELETKNNIFPLMDFRIFSSPARF